MTYSTITPASADPATCAHTRRAKFDSHRCLDCGTEVTPCPAKDISLGNCSGELGHTGDHYLNTIYGRANWGNDYREPVCETCGTGDEPTVGCEECTERRLENSPERACVICGTPENGVYTSHNRCCWDPDNIEEV